MSSFLWIGAFTFEEYVGKRKALLLHNKRQKNVLTPPMFVMVELAKVKPLLRWKTPAQLRACTNIILMCVSALMVGWLVLQLRSVTFVCFCFFICFSPQNNIFNHHSKPEQRSGQSGWVHFSLVYFYLKGIMLRCYWTKAILATLFVFPKWHKAFLKLLLHTIWRTPGLLVQYLLLLSLH